MITEKTEQEDIKKLLNNWSNDDWITDKKLRDLIHSSGFALKKWNDYSHVGKGIMNRYFSEVFERDIKPKIIAVDKERGEEMADVFRQDVEHTIELYKANKLLYVQFVATKYSEPTKSFG